MICSNKEKAVFRHLLTKSIDGTITPSEVDLLNILLDTYPELEKYYFDNVLLQFLLPETHIILDSNQEAVSILSNELWAALAEYEKTAPVVEVTKETPDESNPKVAMPALEKKKLSKFNFVFLALNAAAILFVVLILQFAPTQSVEVATLSDSINAKWADVDSSMHIGTRLFNSHDKLMLREGFVELVFDNNAKAVIEGPAEFQILADDRIGLTYGKICTTVPPEAVGFSVYTANSKIIDMGTEFGVQADFNGNTELSVLKGKIMLLAGDAESSVKTEVLAGFAKKISGITGIITDIECQTDYYVRDINSELNEVWRGQTYIDLADIVGGGNGFGTGKGDIGIDPTTGKTTGTIDNDDSSSTNEYHPAQSNPYIDGVFIPNGRIPQVVSSQGHIFRECPVSSGDWFVSFHNVKRRASAVPGSPYVPCIIQHANMGITYDLQAIRSLVPGSKLVRFQTKLGIGLETDRPCNADFWILVDGELRYQKTQVKQKNRFFTATIELSDNDRFLTLVTTDGQDPKSPGLLPNDSDWCRFAEPTLVLE